MLDGGRCEWLKLRKPFRHSGGREPHASELQVQQPQHHFKRNIAAPPKNSSSIAASSKSRSQQRSRSTRSRRWPWPLSPPTDSGASRQHVSDTRQTAFSLAPPVPVVPK